MMDGATWVGIGLTVIGLGFPVGIALLQFGPRKRINCVRPGEGVTCDDHKSRLNDHGKRIGHLEQVTAVLANTATNIESSLVRIEHQLEAIGRQDKQ